MYDKKFFSTLFWKSLDFFLHTVRNHGIVLSAYLCLYVCVFITSVIKLRMEVMPLNVRPASSPSTILKLIQFGNLKKRKHCVCV